MVKDVWVTLEKVNKLLCTDLDLGSVYGANGSRYAGRTTDHLCFGRTFTILVLRQGLMKQCSKKIKMMI